jgi:hypothetical protein
VMLAGPVALRSFLPGWYLVGTCPRLLARAAAVVTKNCAVIPRLHNEWPKLPVRALRWATRVPT